MFMADTNKATISPVGVSWKNVRDSFPTIQLYAGDGSHPNIYGSYLAACVFYSTIYQKSTIGSTFIPAGINSADALILQTVASYTVLDSLSLWRINASLPFANFNFIVNPSNGTVTFTNTSTNSVTYDWSFGDGNSSTLENPAHTYSGSNNNYPVQLIIYSTDSCFSDTITQTVNISTTGVINFNKENDIIIYPNPANNFIKIKTDLKYVSFTIIDVTGKTVKHIDSQTKIIVTNLTPGIYFIKLIGEEKSVIRKFVKR